MRLLGIDWGSKRIGIALAEQEFGVVNPRPPLTAAGALKRDAEAIDALAKREGADALVVGLPVEESGDEGRMARVCRQLAEHLRNLGHTVHLVDETLSSVQAEEGLRRHDLKASQRRKLRDGEAASLILERYLHEKS
jgi:putative holliday junction resolvase